MNAQGKSVFSIKIIERFSNAYFILKANIPDDCIISTFIYVIINMVTFLSIPLAKEQYINRILGFCVISFNSNVVLQSFMDQ